jgi:hypothetical protein
MTNARRAGVAMTWPQIYATGGLSLAIAGAVGAAVVRFVSPAPFIGAFGFSEAAMLGYAVAGVSWATVGALLVVRRPENAIGWLMVVVGVGYALSQLTVAVTFSFAAEGTARGDGLAQLTGWATVALQLVTVLPFAIGFLFPTGRAQSPGWARFMRLFWMFVAAFVLLSLTQPGPLQLIPGVQNPFGFGPDLRGGRAIAPTLVLSTLAIFTLLVVSMVTRYRSADGIERQQMKWFVLALSVSAVALGIVSAPAIVTDHPADEVGLAAFAFAGAFVPLAIGIAILKHHLYDIDRLVSRTVAYGLISGILVAAYAATILLIHLPLRALTDGDAIPVALSTLVVAALFQPVRTTIQRVVDRRFDRGRYDAERTMRRFGERLRNEVDIAAVTSDLVRTAEITVAPANLAIWLRSRGAER